MVKQTPKIGEGAPGPGRPKGVPNKTTTALKEAILRAAELAGADMKGKDGLIGYCQFLAVNEPKSFTTLLGRVLPLQVAGDPDNPVRFIGKIERVIVRPEPSD